MNYKGCIVHIEYESKIIDAIRKDNKRNNTIHFDWDRGPFEPHDYILRVVTRHIYNGQLFLLKQVEAPTHVECFKKMLEYVNSEVGSNQEYSWTVFWVDDKGMPHMSYFRAVDEDEVRGKFNYANKNAIIEKIVQNPIS